MTATESDVHLHCISDFCGNNYHPGFWSDVWQRTDGSRYITLNGGWEFYAIVTPEVIEDTDPHYAPFLKACESGAEIGYAEKHWQSHPA